MDTVLGQLSELRKLWDSIGYLKDGNSYQSISEWQIVKLQVKITLVSQCRPTDTSHF